MWNGIGIALGAVAILLSISLHEFGHLVAGKATGMKATRFFVGFGPTIWSVTVRGTEYGAKAIPLGGFVTIVGIAKRDEDAHDPQAMWRFPLWRRTVVMAAGSLVHLVIAFLIFWAVAANVAMPNPANRGPFAGEARVMSQPAFVSVAPCVDVDLRAATRCATTDGPAWVAGLRDGDRIVRLGGSAIITYGDLIRATRGLPPGRGVGLEYLRGASRRHTTVRAATALRPPADDPQSPPQWVPVLGIGLSFNPSLPRTLEYNAIEAIGVAGAWMGNVCSRIAVSVADLPQRTSDLWGSVTGGPRDPRSPMSVVGVSRVSGELMSMRDYPSMLGVIAALNVFMSLFNMLPLLPLDGGHIAVAWFNGLRTWLYRRLGEPQPEPVDHAALLPLTVTVLTVVGSFTLLALAADIVNPVSVLR